MSDESQYEQGGLALADFLEALRDELMVAQAMSRDALRLEVETLTVELHVSASQSVKGQGGVKFWVVNAGMSADAKTDTHQRVTLELRLTDGSGMPIDINDME